MQKEPLGAAVSQGWAHRGLHPRGAPGEAGTLTGLLAAAGEAPEGVGLAGQEF